MLWVIIANTSTCRIYDYNVAKKTLTLVRAMIHPESKLKSSNLVSDKQGKYIARDSEHGSYAPHKDIKAIEIENFARDIANELEFGRNHNLYEQVFLCAPVRMKGSIKQQLSHSVINLIKRNIGKDYTHLSEPELIQMLEQYNKTCKRALKDDRIKM